MRARRAQAEIPGGKSFFADVDTSQALEALGNILEFDIYGNSIELFVSEESY